MSDDLVKRLRGGLAIGEEAADRIEELEADLQEAEQRGYAKRGKRIEELEKACKEWSEVSQSNYQRAKAAEAKLAELLEIGDVMATSIEGNYYIAGIAKKWREAINIKGEQP